MMWFGLKWFHAEVCRDWFGPMLFQDVLSGLLGWLEVGLGSTSASEMK